MANIDRPFCHRLADWAQSDESSCTSDGLVHDSSDRGATDNLLCRAGVATLVGDSTDVVQRGLEGSGGKVRGW